MYKNLKTSLHKDCYKSSLNLWTTKIRKHSITSLTLIRYNKLLLMKIKFIIIILCSYFTNLISQETIVLADKGNIHADTIAASVFLQKEEALVTAGDYQAALDVVLKAKALYEKHKLWEEAIRCAINLSVLADNFDGTALKSR